MVCPFTSTFVRYVAGVEIIVAVLGATCALAQPIVIGQTTSLTGPPSAFAKPVSAAIEATFADINASGGIGGRRLQLMTLDDGFDPKRAVENVNQLIDQRGAIALIASNGAPAAQAISPILQEKRVPLIGSTQGAPNLRDFNRYRFYLRASYRDEVQQMLANVKSMTLPNIAIAYFDNPFGQAGDKMTRAIAAEQKLDVLASVALTADRAKNEAAATALIEKKPSAIIVYSLAQPAAELIRAYRQKGGTANFYSISVVSGEALFAAIGKDAAGTVIAQLFPTPQNRGMEMIKQYRQIAEKAKIEVSYAGLEGYVMAQALIEALRRVGANPTSEKIAAALESRPISLGGFDLRFSPNNRNGTSYVDLTMVTKSGSYVR
jgi:branched-chain amino acid transport system substrate-binding protein